MGTEFAFLSRLQVRFVGEVEVASLEMKLEPLLYNGGSQPWMHSGVTCGTSKKYLYLGLPPPTQISGLIGLGFGFSIGRPTTFWLSVEMPQNSSG